MLSTFGFLNKLLPRQGMVVDAFNLSLLRQGGSSRGLRCGSAYLRSKDWSPAGGKKLNRKESDVNEGQAWVEVGGTPSKMLLIIPNQCQSIWDLSSIFEPKSE